MVDPLVIEVTRTTGATDQLKNETSRSMNGRWGMSAFGQDGSSVQTVGLSISWITREELRRVVGFSVADEITKLDQLKKSGSVTDDEFKRLRARVV